MDDSRFPHPRMAILSFEFVFYLIFNILFK